MVNTQLTRFAATPASPDINLDGGLINNLSVPNYPTAAVVSETLLTQNRQSVDNIEFLGEVKLPTGTVFTKLSPQGFTDSQTEIGGLSGLAYDANRGVYYALADDRSAQARFYTLDIDLSDGRLDAGTVTVDASRVKVGDITFSDVTFLSDKGGAPFVSGQLDPEGIALTNRDTLYIASEGDANQQIAPFLREQSLDGGFLSELPIPESFLPTADQSQGIRNNLAFESLTITPDQRFLYTAVENALFQDGPAADLDQPSLARILKYDLTTGKLAASFVYEVDAVPEVPNPADSFRTNGLVELLAVDNNGTLLALERSFSNGQGNTVKLFEVQTQGALDVKGVTDLFREEPLEDDGDILPPAPFEIDPAVTKRELLDIERDLGIAPDNLEALALGSKLADGRQSLIIASDNNFNAGQVTQFLAFAVDFNTTPAVLPVLETPYTVDAEPEALDILLVNDDGFEAEGIEVLYAALVAAGHNVTLVAPKEQQSGTGTKINVESLFRPTEVVEFAPNQWFVDGTPVTTTLAGLDFILGGEDPDLVISGINAGANIGESIAISSGTVSAATEATRAGISAIAISAGTTTDVAQQTAIYERGAEFVIDLISQLENQRSEDEELLPEGIGLNVNIPTNIAAIEGVAITRLDDTSNLNIFVGDLGTATQGAANGIASLLVTPTPAITPEQITVPESEGQNFLANLITITPIDGDWTAGETVRQALSTRLEGVPAVIAEQPLDILLTNDDGFDSEGIEILYEALTARGHRVTLVGPETQQSGTGTALDTDLFFRPLELEEFAENQWYVGAGVRTTTWAGLDFILDEAPDLVISGINEGENIGPGGAVSSGTVSAAVTALLRDVPAIAISGGIDFTTFGTPTKTYEAGANYLVSLINDLQVTQGDAPFILPEGIGLSINIPTRLPAGVTEIQGVKFTNASDVTPLVIDFGPVDATGGVGLRFAPFSLPSTDEVDPLSEGAQFLSGFITVTPLDGDWTVPDAEFQTAQALLTAPTPELRGDTDDPAIWVNPTRPENSVVYGTLKDGGLAVFNLQGEVIQQVLPEGFGEIRYNNVDLIYNALFPSQGGELALDLAVVSDRENDTLAIFAIDAETGLLTDVTAPALKEAAFSIFGEDDGEATAYGLATYQSPVTGKLYAFVTQADGNKVAQIELLPDSPTDAPLVDAQVVRIIELPIPVDGEAADSQSEGIVVDQELGLLYVAIEGDFGILRFSAEPEGGNDFSLVQSIEADYLVPDLEGLDIYYGENGTGYLIANSQGDSSYAVFSREGSNEYLGSFVVGENGPIDQVNESDGLDVINVSLGSAFPHGLLVVHDGANDPQNVIEDDEQLENNSTNFKFVAWDAVANVFETPLDIDTSSYDPRHPLVGLIAGTGAGDTLVGDTAANILNGFGGDDTIAGGLGDDILYGENGDDILRGDRNTRSSQDREQGGNDQIYGGNGNDRIGGKSGNDRLFGEAGDDQIWGDDGDDLLRGGLGNDQLTGDNQSRGTGIDTFVLAAGEGTDTIQDFKVGTDLIGLVGGLTFGALTFAGNAIQFEDETLAILRGVNTTTLTANNFVTL